MKQHPDWLDTIVIYSNITLLYLIVGASIWVNEVWVMTLIMFPILAIVSWDAKYKVLN